MNPASATEEIPLPPEALQRHVFSRDVSAREYLEVGRACADSLHAALASAGRDLTSFRRALDFGCGSARVLRHFSPWFGRLEFHGSDVAESCIAWDREHVPGVTFHLNSPHPPSALPAGSFDLIWAISVFSHLPEDMMLGWLVELARLLEPGGLALLTVHGRFRFDEDKAAGVFSLAQVAAYKRTGFTYARTFSDGVLPEWYQGAFMREDYARATFGRYFDVLDYQPRGMSGRQDIVVCRGRG